MTGMSNSRNKEFNGVNWLSSTDSAVDLHFARNRLAELERRRLDELLASLSGAFFVDANTVAMIRRDQSYVLSRLRGMLAAAQPTDEAVGAAILLCGLGEKSGLELVTNVLRAGGHLHRERILAYIVEDYVISKEWDSYREFLAGNGAFVSAMCDLLDDRDSFIVVHAIRVCHKLRLTDVLDRFRGMLSSDEVTDLQRLALLECLTETELTEDVFKAALQLCEVQKQSDGKFLRSLADDVLLKFAVSADEPIKWRASQCLKELITFWLDKGESYLDGIGVGGVLDTLCESADELDLPWLRRVAMESRGRYPTAPLIALIRIVPDEGRQLLFDWLSDEPRVSVALAAARHAYIESGDRELLSVLQSMAKHAKPRLMWWIVNSLLCIGGRAAVDELGNLIESLSPHEVEYFRSSSNLLDPTDLLMTFEKTKTLHPIAMQKLKVWWEREGRSQSADSVGILELFEIGECSATFDLATMQTTLVLSKSAKWSDLTGSYQQLIHQFAAASCGMFHPENLLAEFLDDKTDASSVSLEVSFIHERRLYSGRMQEKYDIGRICRMVNAVLKDTVALFQFVTLAPLNQLATFVFARPESLESIAQRFQIVLSDNPEVSDV